VRWRDRRRQKGARGGLRVIYLHLPDLEVLYLLDVYSKDEVADLSPEERREFATLAHQLAEDLRDRHRRGKL